MSEGHRELQQFTRTEGVVEDASMHDFVARAIELLTGERPRPGEWMAGEESAPGVEPHDLPVARSAVGEARSCAFGAFRLWALTPDGTLELVVQGLPAPLRLRLLRDEDTLLLSAQASEPQIRALAELFKAEFKKTPA